MKDLILYKYENGHKFYDQATGLEIVNWKMLPGITSNHVFELSHKYKDGDTFPLPSDLKFEEKKECKPNCWDCINGCIGKKVLRLVKTEGKEKLYYKCYKCGQTVSKEFGVMCTAPMPIRTSGICGGSTEIVISEDEYRKFIGQPEPEESQTELTEDEYFKLLGVDRTHAIAVTIWDTLKHHNFTISRKRPS